MVKEVSKLFVAFICAVLINVKCLKAKLQHVMCAKTNDVVDLQVGILFRLYISVISAQFGIQNPVKPLN